MIEIQGNLINAKNIAYVTPYTTATDSYVYQKTYHIEIIFNNKCVLTIKTYDKNEFDEILELLKKQ